MYSLPPCVPSHSVQEISPAERRCRRLRNRVLVEPTCEPSMMACLVSVADREGTIAPRVFEYKKSYICLHLPLKTPAGTASRVMELATFWKSRIGAG